MPEFLYTTYFNNTVSDYLLFLISLIACSVLIRIIGHFFVKRLTAWAKITKTSFDNLLVRSIRKHLLPIAYFAAFYLNTKILYLNPTLTKIVNTILLAFITIMGAIFVCSVAVFFFNKYWENKTKDAKNDLALKGIAIIIKAVIWCIALLLFLDNIGIKVTSLIAGLGIGGVAIAFAAQAVLADIFCFFTIFFDRPYEIGDFIITGEQMGTVEHIGVKTTRLRALSGEQLIFSNADLTGSRIRNYKTLQQRRVLFTIGVAYSTPYEKIREIPELIKNLVEKVQDTTFGRTHFITYGAYSLDFEIVYYVLSSDYDKYMDTQQEINFRLKEAFEKQGIEFAFPAQIVRLQNAAFISDMESEKID